MSSTSSRPSWPGARSSLTTCGSTRRPSTTPSSPSPGGNSTPRRFEHVTTHHPDADRSQGVSPGADGRLLGPRVPVAPVARPGPGVPRRPGVQRRPRRSALGRPLRADGDRPRPRHAGGVDAADDPGHVPRTRNPAAHVHHPGAPGAAGAVPAPHPRRSGGGRIGDEHPPRLGAVRRGASRRSRRIRRGVRARYGGFVRHRPPHRGTRPDRIVGSGHRHGRLLPAPVLRRRLLPDAGDARRAPHDQRAHSLRSGRAVAGRGVGRAERRDSYSRRHGSVRHGVRPVRRAPLPVGMSHEAFPSRERSFWERGLDLAAAYGPFLTLAVGTAFAFAVPNESPPLVITGVVALAASWIYFVYPRGDLDDRQGQLRVYYAGYIVLAAVLIGLHPFFFIFPVAAFFQAYLLKPPPVTFAAVLAASLVVNSLIVRD